MEVLTLLGAEIYVFREILKQPLELVLSIPTLLNVSFCATLLASTKKRFLRSTIVLNFYFFGAVRYIIYLNIDITFKRGALGGGGGVI